MTTTQTRSQLSHQRDLARDEVKSLKTELELLKEDNDKLKAEKEAKKEEFDVMEESYNIMLDKFGPIMLKNLKLKEEYEGRGEVLKEVLNQIYLIQRDNNKLRDALESACYNQCSHCEKWFPESGMTDAGGSSIPCLCCENCLPELIEIQNL